MKKLLFLLCVAFAGSLSAETKVLAFAGSTRSGSYNKCIIYEAAEIARQMGATVTIIDLKDYPMPLYDGDLESNQGMPSNARKLRQLMINSDAIIISTPEYNGSISGVLKNMIDWVSRNDGSFSQDAFKGKKFAIMSGSPGKGGGKNAAAHLRDILTRVDAQVVPNQVSIPQVQSAFNAEGVLQNNVLKAELKAEIQQLLQ